MTERPPSSCISEVRHCWDVIERKNAMLKRAVQMLEDRRMTLNRVESIELLSMWDETRKDANDA